MLERGLGEEAEGDNRFVVVVVVVVVVQRDLKSFAIDLRRVFFFFFFLSWWGGSNQWIHTYPFCLNGRGRVSGITK